MTNTTSIQALRSSPIIGGRVVIGRALITGLAGAALTLAGCAESAGTQADEGPEREPNRQETANIEAYGRPDLSVAEKAAREPDLPADRYDFLGYVDQIPSHELPPPIAAYLDRGNSLQTRVGRTKEEHDAQVEAEARANHDHHGDLAVVLYADGRVFRERPRAPPERPSVLDHVIRTSTDDDSSGRAPGVDELAEKDIPDDEGSVQPKQVYPLDGRTLVTSSATPWRQVGVRLEADCPGCTSESDPAPLCSGAAVGPRHILTAAHCVKLETFGTRWLTASPAGRGSGYAGNLYPFGRRDVVARVWPGGWSGKTSASAYYDYAILILDDINWSPGWIGFGTQSSIKLDFRDINSAGYPGRNHTCRASPTDDGKCSGYMYRQYATTKSVTAGTIYHRHDTQSGNSGMPLYDYNSDSNSRIVRGVHHGVYAGHNAAHRIRSGSYDLICSTIEAHPSSYFAYGGC